uniref:Uncharacterized protein n=1 Tax=Sphaerodactylus townsendi TaxID=933632 RepID=A0ACB8FYV3_9SAUR
MAAVPKDHVQKKKKGRKGRPQKNLAMAAVPKDQKGRVQKKKGRPTYRMSKQMGGQKKQHRNHVHPDFLKATDKRHAKQKSAPGVKTAKPRKGCSNEENAYRVANPSTSNDVHTSSSGTDTMTLDVAESVPAIPQPLAGELQPALS